MRNKRKTYFSLRNTYLALKMYFVHTFFADYNRIDFNRMDSYTLIHTVYSCRYIHTQIRQYKNIFIGSYSHTLIHIFSSKVLFVLTFFADYSRIDSYTLIHIFKPTHTHIDTTVQEYIYRLIQSYIDTHIQLSRYILFLHYLPITVGLILIH